MAKRQKATKQTRRPWTTDERKKLKAFAKKRIGAGAIAKELKRSSGAIRQEACAMKVSLETRGA